MKGNIFNQGKAEDRVTISEDGDYLYPNSKAIYSIIEFGSMSPHLKQGAIICVNTGNIAYDYGLHRFIGCGDITKDEFEFPYNYRCRIHPIGYNYDNYHEDVEDLCGFDYYEVDEVLELEENPNSTL